MVEAYVLAGELRSSNGDHAVAFDRYEKQLASFPATKQKAAARFASFAPRTELGVRIRNGVISSRTVWRRKSFATGGIRIKCVAEETFGTIEIPFVR